MNPSPTSHLPLQQEIGTLPWSELQPHFARGVVIAVVPQLELIAVAAAMVADDMVTVSRWLTEQQIAPVSDTQAKTWWDDNTQLLSIVVAPWVLVQEPK
ncbi:MAG: DUF2288 family protein [Gammaproteobacteria bacterium]|nr:DUF2288 family protein [Gammaproteobacteria bacterium]